MSIGYRAALSVVCRLLLVALMLNAFAVRAQTTASDDAVMTIAYSRAASEACQAESGTMTATRQSSHSTGGTGVSQFDGTYTGSWSATCPACGITHSQSETTAAGTFTATLVNGVFTETSSTVTSGTFGIRSDISGTVSSSGAITATAPAPDLPGCSGSVSTFIGQITVSGGSVPTTQIVASGVWNTVLFTPACNTTDQGTLSFTYANGAYSFSVYMSSRVGGNCQNRGPQSYAGAGLRP